MVKERRTSGREVGRDKEMELREKEGREREDKKEMGGRGDKQVAWKGGEEHRRER